MNSYLLCAMHRVRCSRVRERRRRCSRTTGAGDASRRARRSATRGPLRSPVRPPALFDPLGPNLLAPAMRPHKINVAQLRVRQMD